VLDRLREIEAAATLAAARCISEGEFDLAPYYEGRRDAFREARVLVEDDS
jgi:hypothetical protein